jgi:hypothetical protein
MKLTCRCVACARQPPGPIENGRASYAIPSIAGRMVLRSRRESPHQPPRE